MMGMMRHDLILGFCERVRFLWIIFVPFESSPLNIVSAGGGGGRRDCIEEQGFCYNV